jgi:DNA primase catalytic core
MARIPAEEIDRLKTELSLVRLMEGANYALKRQGKDFAMRCPFHEGDHDPSLLVSESKNLFHCFACGAAGTPIDWVMRTQGVSFRHAVELLRHEVLPLAAGSVVKQSTVPKLPAPVSADADDQAALRQVIDYYHETLKTEPEALAYLAARGIDHAQAVATFRLGYANRTLGLRLPHKNRVAGAHIRTGLQRLGLYRENGREHFNGSLVIPVIAPEGTITEVYGRKLRDDLREGTPKHLYLPGPHRGVWNEAALATSPEIILTESLIDALTFWCAGYRNVTASYGVEGFTADHLAAFERHGIERVLIAYDRDAAGDAAAAALAVRLIAAGIACYRVLFPRGMDANDYALKVTPATHSLGVAIRAAQWLGNGVARPITTTPTREVMNDETTAPGAGAGQGDRPAGRALDGGDVAADAALAGDGDGRVTRAPARADAENAVVADAGRAAAHAALGTGGLARGAPGTGGGAAVVPGGGPVGLSAGRSGAGAPGADRGDANGDRRTSDDGAPAATGSGRGEEKSDGVTVAAAPLPLPASPVPVAPPDLPVEVREHDVVLTFADRRYRVRGLAKNLAFDVLRVNVMVGCGARLHVDTLDLYQAKARAVFVKQASLELGLEEGLLNRDLGQVLLQLETLQEAAITQATTPKAAAAPVLTERDTAQALDLLRDPQLMARIAADVAAIGVVGEDSNALVAYLACVSRLLEKPLAILIQSTSAAGKSTLMDALLSLMPQSERVHYSAMTGQSLFYLGEQAMKHKVLAIAEEEGVRQAAYALKLLQSQGELTIASTGKDATTGQLVTQEYRVEGPVMLCSRSTRAASRRRRSIAGSGRRAP